MEGTMYDRLGDLLNETLEAGEVRFIKVEPPSDEHIPGETPADQKRERQETDRAADRLNKPKKKKRTAVIYKKISDETNRAFHVLGLNPTINKEEVKKAYKEKLKAFHPDRYDSNPVMKKIATDKTREVVGAYDTIIAFIDGSTGAV